MLIAVINDLVEIKRLRIEAPAVGSPMLTSQLFLRSNCGNQIYVNSMLSPDSLRNGMVSATIANTFSPSYSIQASGDPPVKITTTTLGNLEFELVDGNFEPIKLMNPLYLTVSVSPAPDDPNDLAQWNGKLPRDAPTSEQKAEQDKIAQQQQKAQQKADALAQAKEDTTSSAMQLIVQYFGPLVQQQQALVAQQQQKQQLEQNEIALLRDPTVLQSLEQIPEEEAPQYLDELAQQMQQQQQQQQEQQDQIAEEEEQQAEEPPTEPTIDPIFWDADNIDKTL
jgi:hypothetical protein